MEIITKLCKYKENKYSERLNHKCHEEGKEDGQLHIGTPPITGTSPEHQQLRLCAVAPLPLLSTRVEMLSFVRFYLVPALKLYLLGFKVLLTQLFSKSFRLPGQSNTVELGVI